MGSGRVAGGAPGAAGLTKIEPARPEPLGSEVARRLLDYLLSGQVRPGERIPSERQLAEDLGVNRPAVREAIRVVGFLGLLEVRQGSGAYFRGHDQDLLFRLFEWSLLFDEMRTADPDGFPDADVAFHTEIADMADNVVLKDMLAGIRTMIRGWVG